MTPTAKDIEEAQALIEMCDHTKNSDGSGIVGTGICDSCVATALAARGAKAWDEGQFAALSHYNTAEPYTNPYLPGGTT